MRWALAPSKRASLTNERSMISLPGSASTSSGNVGPHMLSRAVVVLSLLERHAWQRRCHALRRRHTVGTTGGVTPRAKKITRKREIRMSTKPKGNESQESQGTSTQVETREAHVDNATHIEEIRRRACEIYLERGE
jgi:hypothetical protein